MITVEITPWRLHWKGGRLADITHVEHGDDHAIACIQVGDWDDRHDRFVREPDEGSLRLSLGEWIAEDGPAYLRELPYL